MSLINVNLMADSQGGSVAPTSSVMRNRIINGAMVIDQRNAGASFAVNETANLYALDRWCTRGETTDGAYTVQRVTDAPAGFTNSQRVTVTTADASIGATQLYRIFQPIEGFNVADLGFGAAGASSVTLSFWVKSSLTGTFSGSLNNSGFSRAYPYTYTISAANTWEYKTVTIAGDTTGTWLKDNGVGMQVSFALGCGADRAGTAGAWNSSINFGATGAVNVISTNGATFYITGVQLEKGTQATGFEYRQIGTELQLCQRYYQTVVAYLEAVVSSGSDYAAVAYGATSMRASPTATGTSTTAFNFPASAGALTILDTRTIYDRRRASGTGAGNFTTSITLSSEL